MCRARGWSAAGPVRVHRASRARVAARRLRPRTRRQCDCLQSLRRIRLGAASGDRVTGNRLRIGLLVVVALAAAGTWIGRNTYWDELKIPMPPKGEALVNPFYAAQRFAEALGARTTWD